MGQERCRAMPKGDLNHAKTRSKIGHRRVPKEKFERTSLFLLPLPNNLFPKVDYAVLLFEFRGGECGVHNFVAD